MAFFVDEALLLDSSACSVGEVEIQSRKSRESCKRKTLDKLYGSKSSLSTEVRVLDLGDGAWTEDERGG
jgi:hypothetical protein